MEEIPNDIWLKVGASLSFMKCSRADFDKLTGITSRLLMEERRMGENRLRKTHATIEALGKALQEAGK